MQATTEWDLGQNVWRKFTQLHPELGYRAGLYPFHNFLRLFREELVQHDALRMAKNKHWIAHYERFCAVAFECATGYAASMTIRRADGGTA